MQAFVEARYEYHWAPLLGCLVGHCEHIGMALPSHVVGAVTGISYQPPQDARLPSFLKEGLAALGVRSQITDETYPNRFRRFRARRRIRGELQAGRPVTAFGVGVSAFGPAWGLIVGCDDQRRVWRRDGPMTEQVSPWLPESDFDAYPALILITARRGDADDHVPGADERSRVAASAFVESTPRSLQDFEDRIDILNSDQELDPQLHSYEAQTLAANWGEAATFWREHPHPRFSGASQHLAVALSRYATLFPYPMGGQPNNPGVRDAAVRVLKDASDALDDLDVQVQTHGE